MSNYLCTIKEPLAVVTAIDNAARFPESLTAFKVKYDEAITLFIRLIKESKDSGDLLFRIRNSGMSGKKRMALLKMFRRCVSTVLDTEAAKKSEKAMPTQAFIEHFGGSFKPIDDLRAQFDALSSDQRAALAALVGEYDTRGRSGYDLTEMFFQWFETAFDGVFILDGPRRAGRDVEVRTLFNDFPHDCPCDFVVRDAKHKSVLAIGFARYDSTRGGAQSDDRTGGNADKLSKIERFCSSSGTNIRLFYLADGPGLAHRDTWKAACDLDGQWNGNVRVTTFKLAPDRITEKWLRTGQSGEALDLRDALDLLAEVAK